MNTTMPFLATVTSLAFCAATASHNASAASAPDPFTAVAETMKHSIAPLACVAGTAKDARILGRRGTVFFISAAGEFMTAAHVLLDIQKSDPPCPVTAIILPRNPRWDPRALNEPFEWFAFKLDDCVMESDLDVAKCPLADNLSSQKVNLAFKIASVRFDWSIPPDGTQLAFIGFPMNARDPMTLRANMAAYRPVWRNEKVVAELLLDRGAWPGSSGSPVFRSDGRVIGMVIGAVTEEGTAITTVRGALAVRGLFADPEAK